MPLNNNKTRLKNNKFNINNLTETYSITKEPISPENCLDDERDSEIYNHERRPNTFIALERCLPKHQEQTKNQV